MHENITDIWLLKRHGSVVVDVTANELNREGADASKLRKGIDAKCRTWKRGDRSFVCTFDVGRTSPYLPRIRATRAADRNEIATSATSAIGKSGKESERGKEKRGDEKFYGITPVEQRGRAIVSPRPSYRPRQWW